MKYEEINKKLFQEFPDFKNENYNPGKDFTEKQKENPYFIADCFIRYLEKNYDKNEMKIVKKCFDFIEEIFASGDEFDRKLLKNGYLVRLYFSIFILGKADSFLEYMGNETKKQWLILREKFAKGDIKEYYVDVVKNPDIGSYTSCCSTVWDIKVIGNDLFLGFDSIWYSRGRGYSGDAVDYCYIVIKDYKLISEVPIGEYYETNRYKKWKKEAQKDADKLGIPLYASFEDFLKDCPNDGTDFEVDYSKKTITLHGDSIGKIHSTIEFSDLYLYYNDKFLDPEYLNLEPIDKERIGTNVENYKNLEKKGEKNMKFKEKHPYIYWELKGIAWIIGAIIFMFGALSFGDNNGFDIDSDAFMLVVGIPTLLALFIGATIMVFSPIVIFAKRLFSKKSKNNIVQKNNGKSYSKIEPKTNNKNIVETYTNIIDTITNSNKEILAKFRNCIDNPKQYYQNNYSIYEQRGIDEYTTDDYIQFWAMIELLLENNYCCELDYKEEVDRFIESIKDLKNAIPFNKENLNPNDDISVWCEEINKEWETHKTCVADIDTDNDSYVLFICDYEKLNYISTLAKKVNCNVFKR